MSQEKHKPSERLVDAYERMMERVHKALKHAEEQTIPNLQRHIDQARDKAVELGELTREEADRIATYLEREGFSVRSAADGREALAEIGAKRPDALVLDLMLPEVNGLEVLRKLRDGGDEVPVIVLSARGGEPDRVAGLELGADDYVAKPASPREIAARVRAVLRRSRPVGPTQLGFGDVVVDVTSRKVKFDPVTLKR